MLFTLERLIEDVQSAFECISHPTDESNKEESRKEGKNKENTLAFTV
jgi:hypothetical protein